MTKKPVTSETMLTYIREHGFTRATQKFSSLYVMNLTKPMTEKSPDDNNTIDN